MIFLEYKKGFLKFFSFYFYTASVNIIFKYNSIYLNIYINSNKLKRALIIRNGTVMSNYSYYIADVLT